MQRTKNGFYRQDKTPTCPRINRVTHTLTIRPAKDKLLSHCWAGNDEVAALSTGPNAANDIVQRSRLNSDIPCSRLKHF